MTSRSRPNSVSVRLVGPLPLLLLVTLSCSSTMNPRSGVTLLVMNGTCVGGHCDSLHVLGFPSAQPATPGGLWSLDLGVSVAPQVCVTIPATATFRVIGENADGTRDTITTTWTDAIPMSLGVVSSPLTRLQALPSTGAFVPARAQGWHITLPGNSAPVPAAACSP